MDDAEKIYGLIIYGLIDEAVEQLRTFRSWLPPLPHVLEEAVFVCAVMHNLRVIDLFEGAQALLPDVGLVVPLVGPERAFNRRSVPCCGPVQDHVGTSGSRAPLPEPSPLRTGHDDCSSSGSSLGRFILAARKIRSWMRPTTASVAVQSTLDHVIGCRPSVCSALTV